MKMTLKDKIAELGRDLYRGTHNLIASNYLNSSDCDKIFVLLDRAEPKKAEITANSIYVNLENAAEQYRALGYTHRNILHIKCPTCGKIAFCDESILCRYCYQCGQAFSWKGGVEDE